MHFVCSCVCVSCDKKGKTEGWGGVDAKYIQKLPRTFPNVLISPLPQIHCCLGIIITSILGAVELSLTSTSALFNWETPVMAAVL